jgi:hypothetical protein
MKNLVQLLAVILLAAFVLPSCNSSLSITKRRYNKGYFVHHNGGSHHLKRSASSAVAAAASTREAAKQQPATKPAEVFHATDFVKVPAQAEPAVRKNDILTASAHSAKSLSKAEKKDLRAQAVELAVKHPVKAIKKVGQLSKDATGDKALSMLWVLIVVILVIYLIGLLLGWAGDNQLFHLLGLIALVLLILWLLRII